MSVRPKSHTRAARSATRASRWPGVGARGHAFMPAGSRAGGSNGLDGGIGGGSMSRSGESGDEREDDRPMEVAVVEFMV